MKHFCIISNKLKDPDGSTAGRIKDYLKKNGADCCLASDKIPENTECVIVLGGDGTLLRSVHQINNSNMPILGINTGTLGFLTDTDISSCENTLYDVLSDRYEIDERMMIKGQIFRGNEMLYENIALNDIIVNRSGNLRIIDFDISVNGEYLSSYSADGVILSTATGSTAYSLSAGGPILQPNAELIMVTPICPHTLNKRSIIFGSNDIITITMNDNKKLDEERNVTFDGEQFYNVITGDRIVISKASISAKFIKTNKDSFLQRVRTKLM